MVRLFLDDTIVAISTPVGKSGIGIVRLSGPEALTIADQAFVTENKKCPSQFASHSLHYGWIINNSQSEVIDEVLLSVMRAPRTYTKEDIVEINCHSGIVVLRRIVELLLKLGARLAQPGEFTKRAYLNGRIDLTQAEAVLDVINSQTQVALNAALGQLQGSLSRKIKLLRKKILDILIQLELAIDFSDQDIQPESHTELLSKINGVTCDLQELLASANQGRLLQEGITCVICGKPNVGKSSLLNAFLKRERAIVTALPGTTRDTLEESIDIAGIPLRLIDTAGINNGGNIAEKEAVRRSRQCIRQAALVLLVLDSSRRLTAADRDITRYLARKPTIVVLNKQDLPSKISMIKINKALAGRRLLSVSALSGRGLDQLKTEIADFLWQGKADNNADILITNIRHKQALQRAQKIIQQTVKMVKRKQPPEIIVLQIKHAQKYLAELVGEIDCTDVLERIFSRFCIGK